MILSKKNKIHKKIIKIRENLITHPQNYLQIVLKRVEFGFVTITTCTKNFKGFIFKVQENLHGVCFQKYVKNHDCGKI